MTNYFWKLNEWVELLLSWDLDKSSKILNDIFLNVKDLKDDNKAFHDNLLLLMSALWEIYMKKWDYSKSLEYYISANDLSESKDFNILFNIWILYNILNNADKWNNFIEKAKQIEPNNKFILEYLKNNNN